MSQLFINVIISHYYETLSICYIIKKFNTSQLFINVIISHYYETWSINLVTHIKYSKNFKKLKSKQQ